MAAVRLTVGLRSALAFQLPGPNTVDWLKAPPDTVGIKFEGREFVWHPPMDYDDALGGTQYGPMVATLTTDDADYRAAAESLQRFLSAVAFAYNQPVDQGSGLGGDGEPDAFHPFGGGRVPRSYPYIYKEEASAALVVQDDKTLRVALAYYREGLNASSPFYRSTRLRTRFQRKRPPHGTLSSSRRRHGSRLPCRHPPGVGPTTFAKKCEMRSPMCAALAVQR
jgi:hypothetical protein